MTLFRRDDPCARFWPVLIDWVEHRAEGPLMREAFGHLERCRPCESELTTIAQTVIALRRLGAQASTAEPPADGWRDLRARLEASRRPSRSPARWRLAWTGSMLGPAVVAILAMRVVFGPAVPASTAPTDDAVTGVSSSTGPARQRYEPGAQRLTEAIVLVIAGQAEPGDVGPKSPVIVPSSTDRLDVPPPARRPVIPSEPTPPRTAIRS